MELKNGYKLVYEVVENGVREFRASKTGVPAADDYVITSNTIGANKLIYEYKGNFYGTGDNFIPTYNENGTPADAALISAEAFAEVFGEPEEEQDNEQETPVNPEVPVDPETPVDPEVPVDPDGQE